GRGVRLVARVLACERFARTPPLDRLGQSISQRPAGPEIDLVAQATDIGNDAWRVAGRSGDRAELEHRAWRANRVCNHLDQRAYRGFLTRPDIDGPFDFSIEDRRERRCDIGDVQVIAKLA